MPTMTAFPSRSPPGRRPIPNRMWRFPGLFKQLFEAVVARLNVRTTTGWAPGEVRRNRSSWGYSTVEVFYKKTRSSSSSAVSTSRPCYRPAMLRIGASSHGESQLRLLRVVRRGDRHDARDLTVGCRFEGDFAGAFVEGASAGLLPGEALESLVHTTARQRAGAEIERFGLALCERLLSDHPRLTRARVEVIERPWNRLEVAGKPQGQVFLTGTPERRTATITSNGKQVAVVAGIEHLTIMRTSGLAPPRPRPGDDADPSGIDDGLQ